MRVILYASALLLAGCDASRDLQISRYDAEAIVKSGGGVTVSAQRMSRYDLEAITKAATEGNGHVVVIQAGNLSRYDMEAIGKAGPGTVIFEN